MAATGVDMSIDPESGIYQCVPNFSEGRRAEVVDAIADAIENTHGARLIDRSSDEDHNRCVMTILGSAGAVRAAALAAARVAVASIDLRIHAGVHPRAGAIDVLPVVPLRGVGREEAVALAHVIGADLAGELGLPVYFYEWAASPTRRTALPDLRRGGFEAFVRAPLTDDRAPDLGPCAAHPSAGIAVVGARGPLVAYNINMSVFDIEIARAVARRIRRERTVRPELEGVRALGLALTSQGRTQVSMNLTNPESTPLPAVFEFVRAEAARLGVTDLESEVIGAIPRAALGGATPESIRWVGYRPTQILETWLERGSGGD